MSRLLLATIATGSNMIDSRPFSVSGINQICRLGATYSSSHSLSPKARLGAHHVASITHISCVLFSKGFAQTRDQQGPVHSAPSLLAETTDLPHKVSHRHILPLAPGTPLQNNSMVQTQDTQNCNIS